MATRQGAGKSTGRRTASAPKTARSAATQGRPAAKSARPASGKPVSGKPAPARPVPGKPGPGSATRGPASAARGRAANPLTAFLARIAAWIAGAARATARWSGGGLPLATMLFSVLGLADSIYLVNQHLTQATSFAGCSDKGAINCEAVTTSSWSFLPPHAVGAHSFGVPVSVLGLAFFVFMVVVNSRWGWRARWQAVHWARLASVIVGIVFVLYLVWAELYRIGAICLYCTGVHIITFVLFSLIVSRAVLSGVRGTAETD